MTKSKLTRRQMLQLASAAVLAGGLAAPVIGGSRIAGVVAMPTAKPTEPWEAYIDEELEIEMGPMYFQLKGQEKNAPITLKIGKIYIIEFTNVDRGVIGKGIPHNALFGKDPDLERRNYKTLLIDNFYGIELAGGEEGEIVFKVPDKPGPWEMGSFVTGQYEAGQHAPIIIEP